MPGQTIKIDATEGNTFDCYLALPDATSRPAVVLMSSIFGVDNDLQKQADDLASQGFIAAAPDLFWRGDAGPMPRTDEGYQRAKARAADREVLVEKGVQDLADVIAELSHRPQYNGQVVVIGFCYGGPYAILGPVRLGCVAGISFHGTKVEDFLNLLDKVNVPLSLHWGDQDHVAPPETLQKIQAAADLRDNVEVIIYPGIAHGYTAPSSDSWNETVANQSWQRSLAILNNLTAPNDPIAS